MFSIFDDTFSHSQEKAIFRVWEKGGENSFLHFLNILLANRRKCEPCQWFLINIHSEYSFSPTLGEWHGLRGSTCCLPHRNNIIRNYVRNIWLITKKRSDVFTTNHRYRWNLGAYFEPKLKSQSEVWKDKNSRSP